MKRFILFLLLLPVLGYGQLNRSQMANNITSNIYENPSHKITGTIMQNVLINQNNSYANLISDSLYFGFRSFSPNYQFQHGVLTFYHDSIWECTTTHIGAWSYADFNFVIAGGGGLFWGTAGNTGTSPSINFLGTKDLNDLVFKVNNNTAGRLSFGGGVTNFGYLTSNNGVSNTAFGFQSNHSNTFMSSEQTGVGYDALYLNTSGFGNTAIGYQAGYSNVTGNQNIFVGAGAQLDSNFYNDILVIGNIHSGTQYLDSGVIGFQNGNVSFRNEGGTVALLSDIAAIIGDSGLARGYGVKIIYSGKLRIIKVDTTSGIGSAKLATQYFVLSKNYLTGNQTITLTGDVTGSGATSIATTIATHAVTYAKMQQASTQTLLGNPANATANIQEITLGSGLSLTAGGVLSATGSLTGSGTQYYTAVWSGTSSLTSVNPGTTNYALVSNGASAYPTYQQVSLTAGVTGILPILNGGTGGTYITTDSIKVTGGSMIVNGQNKMTEQDSAQGSQTALAVSYTNFVGGEEVRILYNKTTASNLVLTFPTTTTISQSSHGIWASTPTETLVGTSSSQFLIKINKFGGRYVASIIQITP